MTDTPWMPRDGRVASGGCVWLLRLIDKARRVIAGEATGQDLITPYMYGDNDYLDAKLLQFLHLTDADVSSVVRAQPDDEKAATELLHASGRSAEECRVWSERFCRSQAMALTMLDMDEGRQGPGWQLNIYNWVILPLFSGIYDRAERRRRSAPLADIR